MRLPAGDTVLLMELGAPQRGSRVAPKRACEVVAAVTFLPFSSSKSRFSLLPHTSINPALGLPLP